MIEGASVLCGGKRHLAHFPDHPARRIELGANVAGAVCEIQSALDDDRAVVVLATGDPMLYGIGTVLIRELGKDRVAVHPAPSSVQEAFALAREPWHDATILSAHGRPLAGIIPAALASTKVGILTDDDSTPARIAEALLAAGMEDCRAMVAEQVGGPNERLIDTHLQALLGQEFDPLNVLLLFREPAAVRLRFGQPDGEFESVRGQITKAEVRAVTLSKLRLAPNGVLWDVGAGSGSLAIEAARLMPRGSVYAVERDPEQLACLQRNVDRHHASNVRVIAGEAPEALASLPRPDAVFLGGSGGRLDVLLEALPRPFVANLAVLEHVSMILERFPEAEVVQLGVARSEKMADGRRLEALNPVYVVSVPG